MIPPERTALETRVVAALLEPDPGPNVKVLRSFSWDDHPELTCIVLDDLVKHQPPLQAGMVARKVRGFCLRHDRRLCENCSLYEVRQRL